MLVSKPTTLETTSVLPGGFEPWCTLQACFGAGSKQGPAKVAYVRRQPQSTNKGYEELGRSPFIASLESSTRLYLIQSGPTTEKLDTLLIELAYTFNMHITNLNVIVMILNGSKIGWNSADKEGVCGAIAQVGRALSRKIKLEGVAPSF
jgi:hypothetical protein